MEKFRISKDTSSNKTIRMPDSLIDQLQKVANENDISFNKVVIQCCQYALEHLSE